MAAAVAPIVAHISLLSSSPPVLGGNDIRRVGSYDPPPPRASSPSNRPANRHKTGSRAATIPDGAVTGFRSASALVKEVGIGGDGTEGGELPKQAEISMANEEIIEEGTQKPNQKKRKKPSTTSNGKDEELVQAEEEKHARESKLKQGRKRIAASKLQAENPEEVEREKRKAKLDNLELANGEEVTGKSKPKQRRRRLSESKPKLDKKPVARNKEIRDGQATVRVQEATKPQTVPTPEPKTKAFKYPPGCNVTDETSKYFQKKGADRTAKQASETFQLGQVKRNEDGPRQNSDQQIADKPENIPSATEKCIALVDLVGAYGYDQENTKLEEQYVKSHGEESLAKRPRMESEAVPLSKKQNAATIKSPMKKKLATITANAIAKVQGSKIASAGHLELGSQDEPIGQELQTFDILHVNKPHILTSKAKKSVSKDSPQDGGVPKKKKSNTKANKLRPVESKLRSPESAMRRMQRQDFLFGTSSQIVGEDDPILVHDLRLAIKASEVESEPRQASENIAHDTGKRLPIAVGMLWKAGAQGDSEACSLLGPQVTFDHQDRPQEPRHSEPIDLVSCLSNPTPCLDASAKGPEAKSTGSRLKLSSAPLAKPKLIFQAPKRTESSLSSHTVISQILSSHAAVQAMQMSTGTDAVKSLGNSKANPRTKSKAIAPANDDAEPPVKRPRGRPRKDATATIATPTKTVKKRKKEQNDEDFVPIDEIEDHDPPTPSPPRRHSRSVPAPLEFSASREGAGDLDAAASEEARAKAEAASRAKAAAEKVLFAQITKAVKSAPRSADPKIPSWWEKILMYDPIILEDLTAWLNDGALEAAGGSTTATVLTAAAGTESENGVQLKPAVVRKWCDKHSICCIWRDGGEWR